MRLTFLLTALALLNGPAQARDFVGTVNVGDHSLDKCRESKLEKYFYDLGHVALYRQDCNANADKLINAPVYLEFAYSRSLEGEDFADSAYKIIKDNISDQEMSTIEDDLRKFNDAYQSIGDGDRYTIAYSEATGLVLSLNGKKLTSSDNQELAKHYFTIWFGDKPFSKKLKNKLLEE